MISTVFHAFVLCALAAVATNQKYVRQGIFLNAKSDDISSARLLLATFKNAGVTLCPQLCLSDNKCNFIIYHEALQNCELLYSITLEDLRGNVVFKKVYTYFSEGKLKCDAESGRCEGSDVSNEDIYSSCEAALTKNNFQTANYSVLPSGFVAPLRIECQGINGTSFAVLHHNDNTENLTKVNNFEAKGSYKFYFTYRMTMSIIATIISLSKHCQQHTLARCHDSMFVMRKAAWLYGRDMQKLGFWGGGPSDGTGCACGITNTCASTTYKCNCDKNDKTWRIDEGNVVEKDVLPITGIAAGDTGGETEMFEYKIGPLLCLI